MIKPLKIIALIGLVSFVSITSSESSSIKFRTILNSKSLSKNVIRDIVKDRAGFIWFGTNNGLLRYDGYQFKKYQSIPKNLGSLSGDDITKLHIDSLNNLWIGTKENGLNLYNKSSSSFLRVPINGLIYSIASNHDRTYFIAGTNLHSVKVLKNNHKNDVSQNYYINTLHDLLLTDPQFILKIDNETFLIATKTSLVKYEIRKNSNNIHKFSKLISFKSSQRIRKIIKINSDNFFLATDKGLLNFSLKEGSIKQVSPVLANKKILDIVSASDGLWISVFNEGIVNYSVKKSQVKRIYQEDKDNPHSIAYNTLTSLYAENTGGLWLGGFSKGVSQLSFSSRMFELYNEHLMLLSCLTSSSINGFYKKNHHLFVATEAGLYLLEPHLNRCKKISSTNKKDMSVYSFHENKKGNIFVGTNLGLYKVEIEKDIFNLKYLSGTPEKSIYFIHSYSFNELLIGTYGGLYIYNLSEKRLKVVNSPVETEKLAVYSLSNGSNGDLYIASNHGALVLDSKRELKQLNRHRKVTQQTDYLSHSMNTVVANNGYLWFGTKNGEIIKFSEKEKTYSIIPSPQNDMQILSMIFDEDDQLWISSDSGLFKLNTDTKQFQIFNELDGLQSDIFIRGSSYKDNDGRLYFGGRNGFNAFYPKNIKLNSIPPKVVLTKLTRFNKNVEAKVNYQGFSIDKPIEYLEALELSHRDYMIGFEFTGLHFEDPLRNQYAYMLEGLHNEWSYTDAQNRNETFTNLDPGQYVFRVKAANKDGVWSLEKDSVALKIRVLPAPWLTWWAFVFYGLVLITIVIFVIQYRTRKAVQHAQTLELKVKERTEKINTQKHLIETLLERKNELFVNISHEFRTPLTLILGPLEKELQTLNAPKNYKHLSMMYRNASRLMGMIEQILKLTELKKEASKANRLLCAVNATLMAIIESFLPLAHSKSITLIEELGENCNILSSQDGLETMVGNLLSNAIKYTAKGGRVLVSSRLSQNQVIITVSDNGFGMSLSQQDKIFDRFVRLNRTSDIAGTGIGLSIVQELVKNHGGKIEVNSELDMGSSFILTLPITLQEGDDSAVSIRSIKSIEHLTHSENLLDVTNNGFSNIEALAKTSRTQNSNVNSLDETILIIDDNPDMQQYIQDSLENQYLCITTSRGESGLELALKEVPDLVICDIMMPGIDGYEVARQMRSNLITCHIPFILLTARGDKQSRIQGWQKNIDDYMTKPFDEMELRVRIKNILSIRKVLKDKVAEQFAISSKTLIKVPQIPSKRFSLEHASLNSLDKQFVRKLVQEIKLNYSNKSYTSTHMASALFMSSRQLQRKLNALVAQNPMTILRQYRLEKAAEYLLQGKQVGVIANICGFSSLSYFSQCFKAAFKLTPQQYKKSQKALNTNLPMS